MIVQKDNIHQVVEEIKAKLPQDKIILLQGTLASGKTTLVKEFAKSIGIIDTSSPTFSILNNYSNKIYHYDLYNDGVQKFLELGMLEHLEEQVFHFIEWADDKFIKLLDMYEYSYLIVQIIFIDEDSREYKIEQVK